MVLKVDMGEKWVEGMLAMVATLAMVDMTVMVWDMVELQLVFMVLTVTQMGMADICMDMGLVPPCMAALVMGLLMVMVVLLLLGMVVVVVKGMEMALDMAGVKDIWAGIL